MTKKLVMIAGILCAILVILTGTILIKNDFLHKVPEVVETPQPTETPEPTEEPEPTPTPTPDLSRFYDTDSLLVCANKKHKLPDGYVPADLTTPDVQMRYETWQLRQPAAEAMEEMFAAAKEDNIFLVVGSGYRSEAFQKTLYDGYVAQSGVEYADSISSRPGYSDHQTGLATDLCGQDASYDLSTSFETTPEGQWLFEHAHEYGFILRYPNGKEDITGYSYEPWHYRFIGKEEAAALHDAGENMSFEEYYNIEGGDYAED